MPPPVYSGWVEEEWPKRLELGATEDGYMNSYAYTLVIVHYTQSRSPPVVPNLHQLGQGSAPVMVVGMGQRG